MLLSHSGLWTAFFYIHITGDREGGSMDTVVKRVNVFPCILQSIKWVKALLAHGHILVTSHQTLTCASPFQTIQVPSQPAEASDPL